MAFQSFTITSTYDPSTNTITCASEPSPIKIKQGNTGLITVRLQLQEGQPERISFQADPVAWTASPPAGSLVTVSEILITAPNTNTEPEDKEHPFEIKFVYTPPEGDPVIDTGDPTIILEGTGGVWKDHP